MTKRRPLTADELAAADRLRLAYQQRKRETGLTQERLAFDCGWKQQSAASQYITGKIPLNLDALLKLASALGVTPADIFPELAASLPSVGSEMSGDDPSERYEFAIRVHGTVLSAGNGSTHWEHEEIEGSHAFTRTWLRRKGLKIENCRVLTIDGDSMLPELRDGFIVLIDLSDCHPIKSGKVYALSVEGEQRIKRLFPQVDGSLLLSSDNPDKKHYPDEFVKPEHLDRVRIIGRKRWHGGDDD